MKKRTGFSLTFEVEGHWFVSRQVPCKTEDQRPKPLEGSGCIFRTQVSQECIFLQCVVPENIHTPTTEGISRKVPPPPRNFHFLTTKITPPSLRNFHYHFVHPPYPLDKIVLARKCVKVNVNSPNISPYALHITTYVLDRS